MTTKSIIIIYFGFRIEFIIPETNQKWERQIISIFKKKFIGYLFTSSEKVDLQIWFTSKKENKFVRSGSYTYIVPLIKDSLDKKEFGLHLREIFITTMLSLTQDTGGVCIHASSVALGDKAILFLGSSGAGKSTISRLLSSKFKPLTDDTTFLIKQSTWQTSPLPIFEKNIPLQHRSGKDLYKVKALCLIEQSKYNRITKIKKNLLVFQRLVDAVFSTASVAELSSVKKLFESSVSFYRVEFTKSSTIENKLLEIL